MPLPQDTAFIVDVLPHNTPHLSVFYSNCKNASVNSNGASPKMGPSFIQLMLWF